MFIRHRFVRPIVSWQLLWAAFLVPAFPAGAEEEAAAGKPAPVVVRTEADIEQGKRNVRNVVDELAALFEENSARPVLTNPPRQVAPAYARVIAGEEGRSVLVFRPRFTSAKELYKALDSIVFGTVYVDVVTEQNVLMINAPSAEIEQYRAILEAADVPSSQVLIEAKVVEVLFSDGMQRNLSMMFSNNRGSVGAQTEVPGQSVQPTQGASGNWNVIQGKDNLNIAFQWLLTAQDAKVLSSPNILLSRNEISRIVTGEDIPIQEANTVSSNLSITTKFKNVGVELEVEPKIINDDNVTLRVYPQVSNVTRYETITTGSGTGASSYSVPVIAVRSVETHLRMQSGQVVMMGGLYNSRDTLQQQRVPILSDLPWIGELFTGKNYSKEVTQLIFFLKIHIIPPEQVADNVYFSPDDNAFLSEGIGNVLQNMDSFPVRETSVEDFVDELQSASPQSRRARREEYHRRQELLHESFELPNPVPPGMPEDAADESAPAPTPAAGTPDEVGDEASSPAPAGVPEEGEAAK